MKRKIVQAAGILAVPANASLHLISSRRSTKAAAWLLLTGLTVLALPNRLSLNAAQPAAAPADARQSELGLSDLLDAIPPYNPKAAVEGQALLAGSTTMLQLGQQWAARFKQFHPAVEFTRGGDGSDAALKLLQQNPSAIAGLSRMVTAEEVAALEQGNCPQPAVVVVAVEPLAVFVHRDNPLQAVTPQQLQQLFATSDPPIKWSDLGVTGPLADQPIRVHSRIDDDSLISFIAEAVARSKSPLKPAVSHRSGAELIRAIAADPSAVAIGSLRSDPASTVKPLKLELGSGAIEATDANFLSGRYPLARPLTLIFEKSMLQREGGLHREILHYVLSRDGQAEAIRAGFFPVSPNFIAQQIATLSGPQLR